jgi:hypothetical protein
MKVAEWKRVVRPLLPPEEAWEFRGSMCYRLPVNRVLVGVSGEGSGFDKGVYIWRVSMPLFVPSDIVDLSWSQRMGGGARKYDSLDEEALQWAIGLAVEGLESEECALRRMVSRGTETSRNRRAHEVVGYALTLLGDLAAARAALTRARAGTAASVVEQEVIDRVLLIDRLLDEDAGGRAVNQLDRWCAETVGALGLRRSTTPDGRTD